jgi:hypothetical protein
MQARVLSRLRRLRTRTGFPEDYVGERHVVIVEREPLPSSHTGQCEFEERPGPAPPGSDDGVPRVYFS